MGKREAMLSSRSNASGTRAMSQENVEITRRFWQEFQAGMERGDPGAWLDSGAVADDFEWVMPLRFDGKSVWRGREEYVKFIRTWTDEFQDWSIRVERVIDAGGDRVVALTYQSATGKASGAPVELNVGQVSEFEDGRLIRVRNYLTHAEALEAAGLSE
jgi:ketosteroid isomerase-like protein